MAAGQSGEKLAARPPRWPLLVSLVSTVGILLIACAMILDLRREVGARAQDTADSLLHAVERDIARNVEVLDLSLQGAVDGLSRPDVMSAEPHLRNAVLFDRSATATNLGALIVYDADGILKFDSAGIVPRTIAPATDRDYFKAQQAADRGLFISQPYVSRLLGQPVVGLSRRVSGPDGSFAGVALATIQISYFTDLISKLKLGSAGVVSLVRDDGTVIVRSSATQASFSGDNLRGSPVFERMRRERSGSFVGASSLDGVERLYTFTHVGQLPLVLSVALATKDIYSAWSGKALWGGLVLVVICLVVIGLTAVLTRELRRRDVAERGLVAANAELARLSRTDGLTGLCNRRTFDETLDREVRRAARTGRQVALVLLDVDHFKRFNDRYGHGAGDDALRAVAGILGEAATRPGDLAFRVGGEEFALLLPETGLAGAMIVAEKIRLRVRLLGRAHADSPAGILTVSLGATEIRDGDASVAYARADEALYRSKHAGRDRVSAGEHWSAAA